MEPLTDTDHLMIAIASFFSLPYGVPYHTPYCTATAKFNLFCWVRSTCTYPFPIPNPHLPLLSPSITTTAATTISTTTHHAHSLLTYRRPAVSLLSPSLFTLFKSFPHVALFSRQALPAFP